MENLRDASNALLIVGLVLAAFGTFGVNHFRGRVERERLAAAAQRERASEARATALDLQVKELVAGKNLLLTQNAELSGSVLALRGQVEARDSTIQQLRAAVDDVRRYSYVAHLTFTGTTLIDFSGGIEEITPISKAVEGTWRREKSTFYPVCDTSAIERNRAAIRQFPEFPFPYYALAHCLHQSNDPGWRSYAEQALAIFEKTTAIVGHSGTHDPALAHLKQLLGRS